MPNELNTPNHRWYQKRYNIPLAREDYSRQYIYASGISKIDAWIDLLAGRDYSVLGFEPLYVADFDDENYRVQGASTPVFSDALTHAASSNATMVDSDGLLKWRPHNLLTYSEDAASANSGRLDIVSDDIEGPFVGTTADKITQQSGQANGGFIGSATGEFVASVDNTYRAIVKNGNCDWVSIRQGNAILTWFDISSGNVGTVGSGVTASITDLGNGWYEISATASNPDSFALLYLADGDNSVGGVAGEYFYLHRRQNSRTDLGGMVNNPDRGDSYVPTTSSAVYLPRRGHHVYNGFAWVNEGVLHESEARTNLLTYSEQFDNAAWSKANGAVVVSNQAVSPDGQANADQFYGPSGSHIIQNMSASADTAYTVSLFVKSNGTNVIDLAINFRASSSSLGYFSARFDLSTENVTNPSPSFGQTADSAIIESFGNGWYRISVSKVSITSTDTVRYFIGSYEAESTVSDGFYIYGAQIEAGSTPSSYIPTSGATATRAAETLTIPAANLPWPTPEIIGPELVTNGTFDTDVSGWSANASATISAVSGELEITNVGANFGAAYQAITLVAGKSYVVTGSIRTGTASSVECRIFNTATGGGTVFGRSGNVTSGTATPFSFTFVAPSAAGYSISFANSNTTDGTSFVDNISVREINPLAVSIQMDGRMTYADTGIATEVRPFRWIDTDAGIYIDTYLSTSSADEGRIYFRQSPLISVNSESFFPDILVPYNIASRHGSIFVNGAVDGVALTADTTPTALPDLETTDLDLGSDYMGTIRTFRMWADDLGDTGIAAATEPSLVPSLSLTFDGTENSFIVEDWSE